MSAQFGVCMYQASDGLVKQEEDVVQEEQEEQDEQVEVENEQKEQASCVFHSSREIY